MRVVVIGGSGYVASLFAPALARLHVVHTFDRAEGDDALDPDALADAMRGADAVIHSVMTRTDEAADLFDINVKAPYLALAAAKRAGVPHVVHISSLSVYENVKARTVDESVPADARDPYGLTKRLGEQVCRAAAQEFGLSVNILRLAWPTPDDAWPAWKPPWHKGKPILFETPDGTPIHATSATDLGDAVVRALDYRDGCEIFHITGAHVWSAAKARRLLGWRPHSAPAHQ
ncbi:NAD-dependent epimerase/dehydratase family protein [Allorhizocola rhizosphaerae]|uniref:NAD-dependent epimerase/dehydratase family protein n=1 Tax=Allorhizocola rhizosphaerae TaxID=1872709 RepID=UPI000E3E5B82|nr:NAD(P)-dependent oxidoreductase [Allorhizocola rhizosphaerae]